MTCFTMGNIPSTSSTENNGVHPEEAFVDEAGVDVETAGEPLLEEL